MALKILLDYNSSCALLISMLARGESQYTSLERVGPFLSCSTESVTLSSGNPRECEFLLDSKIYFVFQYNKPSETLIPESVDGLQDNLDVVVSLAERHYYNCDFKMCYKLTSV